MTPNPLPAAKSACALCGIPIAGEPYRREGQVYCCEGCALAERELTLCRFRLNDAFLATIRALAAAIEARDPYTAGHTGRVIAYALAIGRTLGLTLQQLACVERGSTLHDVGKIGIPDAVLRKPGRLTPEEWAQMKGHPEIGYQILKKVATWPIPSPASATITSASMGRATRWG